MNICYTFLKYHKVVASMTYEEYCEKFEKGYDDVHR